MKTITLILLGIITILTVTPAMRAEKTETPLPIPDFMTPTQLAVWQQERIAKAHADQAAQAAKAAKASTSVAFYTGKPYLAESGTYSFLAREYNPEMARWTTVDPSGFPDGPNNRVYAAAPTSELDNNGLQLILIQTIEENHSPNCMFWARQMGDGGDWITWYEGNASLFYQDIGSTKASPGVDSLATTFVTTDLGLSIYGDGAKNWTAYSGIIDWKVYRDVEATQTVYEFDFTIKNLYSWTASAAGMSNQVAFNPRETTGKLTAIIPE